MDYQKKVLTEEEISKIYVAEGDIVSFFNAEGKFCSKNHLGEILIIEDKIEELKQIILEIKEQSKSSEEIVTEIDDIIGGDDIVSEEEKQEQIQASEDLLSVL